MERNHEELGEESALEKEWGSRFRSVSERLYGRRRGRPLTPTAKKRLETFLPRVALSVDAKDFSLKNLFSFSPHAFRFEIGFGAGERLLTQAKAHPDIGFLGAEAFWNGISSVITEIERLGLENIKIYPGDARRLLTVLPARSFSEVALLYPDPWPKRGHEGRRFAQKETVRDIFRVLKKGGRFLVASDVSAYIDWTLACMESVSGEAPFSLQKEADLRSPPFDWVQTRYEKKALAQGRSPQYLDFCADFLETSYGERQSCGQEQEKFFLPKHQGSFYKRGGLSREDND